MSDKFYDQPRLLQRIREYQTLILFIIIAAILSVVFMDVLVIPITLLAIHSTALFTNIVKTVLIILPLVYLAMVIFSFFRRYRKEDIPALEICLMLVKSFFLGIGKVITAILVVACIFLLLYFVFYYNNYFLYQLVH